MAILKKGLSGEPVRRLQAKLGVEADGEFGPNTEKALKDWQTKNGLTADGIAGPDTFMTMGLYELVLLKQGTRGNAVKKLQEKLAVTADGQFGAGTEKAVRDYQSEERPDRRRRGRPGHAGADEAVQGDHARHGEGLAGVGLLDREAAKGVVADAGAGLRSIWDTHQEHRLEVGEQHPSSRTAALA